MNPELQKVIKLSPVIVHKGRYAYLKADETEIKNHFLVSKDKDETTDVTEEKNLADTKYEKDAKWFKLLEARISTPFE